MKIWFKNLLHVFIYFSLYILIHSLSLFFLYHSLFSCTLTHSDCVQEPEERAGVGHDAGVCGYCLLPLQHPCSSGKCFGGEIEYGLVLTPEGLLIRDFEMY